MKKVIIITRSSEYGSYKEFQDAIDAREHCKYNENCRLIRFLAARKKWNKTYDHNKYAEDCIVETYKSVCGKECEPFGTEELANVPYNAMRELMTSIDVEPSNPYASFYFPNEQSPECEVILVLCDCVNIMQKEWVQPEDLFLECICDDLGISQSTENILYVHADQIGYKKDGLLVENHILREPIEGNRAVKWADFGKKRFFRIASFVHNTKPYNLFLRNILKKDFWEKTICDDSLYAQNAFFNRVDDI